MTLAFDVPDNNDAIYHTPLINSACEGVISGSSDSRYVAKNTLRNDFSSSQFLGSECKGAWKLKDSGGGVGEKHAKGAIMKSK